MDQVKVSDSFKKQAKKAISAILVFMAVYAMLLFLSIVLIALCVFGGISLITAVPNLFTVIIGLGIIGAGIFVFIFLIKFLFSANKTDKSNMRRITREEEPRLFNLIDKIVAQTATQPPKKVYLTHEVNASVFYDSNFWSMFFPVRKNLTIGMGLINGISVSELESILGHEFGHFSQRSMRIGSYVYNVNRVIYNLLYDNESYSKLISGWGSISGYFSFFVSIAIKIISGIQWLLKKEYDDVNKSYLALSREMEFHADEVAANIGGESPMKSALLKIELISNAYNAVLEFYSSRINKNLISNNVFQEQKLVIKHYAEINDLLYIEGTPVVTMDEFSRFNKSKLVLTDQWSSHPSTEDRVAALDKLSIQGKEVNIQPAVTLLNNFGAIQKELSDDLFSKIQYNNATTTLDINTFEKLYLEDYQKRSFPRVYNSYYSNKNIENLEISHLKDKFIPGNVCFKTLYSDEMVDVVYTYHSLTNDITAIKNIESGNYDIKSFDYNGVKYTREDIASLMPILLQEQTRLYEIIKENDELIYAYFLKLETTMALEPRLETLYLSLLNFDKFFSDKVSILNEMSEALNFINQNTPLENIIENFNQFELIENKFKRQVNEVLDDDTLKRSANSEDIEFLNKYIVKDSTAYFYDNAYDEEKLKVLFTAIGAYESAMYNGYLGYKKQLLDYQVEIENKYCDVAKATG
ncbi:M48 family metalloprotease [Polluticaenibacter yanchengensis]|uniref:M48 family metallopeptidase n=1 Tax=Polluticaenibacter yanchengensis TaxID=3014562 RepID=A0ABT4UIF3_9BACT|nr:M48 family metallopeptidase [Chitinophagaceae bacterium LY-5]